METKIRPSVKIFLFLILGVFAVFSILVLHLAVPKIMAAINPIEKLKSICLADQGEACTQAVLSFRSVNRSDTVDVLSKLCVSNVKPACDAVTDISKGKVSK